MPKATSQPARPTILGFWLLLLWAMAGGGLAAAELSGRIDQGELHLNATPALSQRAVLYQSQDLRRWDPVYSMVLRPGSDRLVLAPTNASAFFSLVETNFALAGGLIWIPPGSFRMGSSPGEAERSADEGPQRVVAIRRGLWMSRCEVNIMEFRQVMGFNPTSNLDTSTQPAANVSFEEALEYCRRITERDRAAGLIPPACAYRLPSEAEWEYACRAGTTTRYYYGDDPGHTVYDLYAWCGQNASTNTRPVGQKLPNAWGLNDMHGNVFEWCLDFYQAYPGGTSNWSGLNHVYRGGSYICDFKYLRSASRHPGETIRGPYLGFRVLLGPDADTVIPLKEIGPLKPQLLWAADGTSVQVIAIPDLADAVARYTLDGSVPTPSSSTIPPTLTHPAVVGAMGFRGNTRPSPLLTVPIEQLTAPTVLVQEGTLYMDATSAGATLEYRIGDGPWEVFMSPLEIPESTVVHARARKAGQLTSGEVELEIL